MIVNVVVVYDCPYRAKTYLLIMRNVLHIPELPLNLLPPFIMREDGVIVDDCPKSQSPFPSTINHSMYFQYADLRIHFELNNTFSSFHTRKPASDELSTYDQIFMTPDSVTWNPYSEHFVRNEGAMLDCNDKLILPQARDYF